MADITRAEALALINQQDATEIWQAAPQFSAALRTFRRVTMSKKQTRYPIIAALPTAGFVAGEDATDATAVKPTTAMSWDGRVLEAEEIGGIVVIPENVIADSESDFDMWGEIRPRIAEAVGVALDAAVFFGTNAPASWPVGLVPGAIAAGNVVTEGDAVAPEDDLAGDINLTLGEVEDDGYEPTAAFARRSIRRRLRGLRADDGQPIFTATISEAGPVRSIYDSQLEYVTNGAWDNAVATLLVGDPNYAILGIRQDITFKMLTEASVTLGGTLISLAERDLLGLRFKMRVGFQTAETLTTEGGSGAYPFAVLAPVGS